MGWYLLGAVASVRPGLVYTGMNWVEIDGLSQWGGGWFVEVRREGEDGV